MCLSAGEEMSKLKQVVRALIVVAQCVFLLAAVALLIFSLVICYDDFGGWWGLFLVVCVYGLLIASCVTAAMSIISLEEWLEE